MSLTSRGPIGGPGKPKSNFKSNCDDLEIFYDLKKGINGMGFEKKNYYSLLSVQNEERLNKKCEREDFIKPRYN